HTHALRNLAGLPSGNARRRAVASGAAPDTAEHPPVKLLRERLGEEVGPPEHLGAHRPNPGRVYGQTLNLIQLPARRKAWEEPRLLVRGDGARIPGRRGRLSLLHRDL